MSLNRGHNSTRRAPQREERTKIAAGFEKKKARKMWSLHLSSPPPFGPSFFWPHLFLGLGPPPSGFPPRHTNGLAKNAGPNTGWPKMDWPKTVSATGSSREKVILSIVCDVTLWLTSWRTETQHTPHTTHTPPKQHTNKTETHSTQNTHTTQQTHTAYTHTTHPTHLTHTPHPTPHTPHHPTHKD